MSKLILFTFLLVIMLAIPIATGEGVFVVAHGDPINYLGSDAPSGNATVQYRVWIFGTTEWIYSDSQQGTNSTSYGVYVPVETVDTLDLGTYIIYVQFPGQNGQFDISFEDQTLKTIYKAIPDVDMAGYISPAIRDKFDQYLETDPVDDIVVKQELSVEDPSIRVKNMYTTEAGDLHMDLITNLMAGNKISAMIDEDVYNVPEYRKMMSDSSTVMGDSNRSFSLDFTSKASEQLPSGMHFITIHFLEDGRTTIPIERYSRYVPPTPTPVMEYYYDFSGEMLGYDINTTRPATMKKTPAPTQTPINYRTVLNVKRVDINNRSVEQRGYIYLGEENLDIYGTLGWMSTYRGDYGFTVQYCEYGDVVDDASKDILQIKDPHHFYVDPDIFRGKLGAWCQHQTDVIEEHPPIAFFVVPASSVYNTTTGDMENGLADYTDNKTPARPRNATKALTVPNVEDTIYVTPTEIPTPPPTPVPIPTTESIVLPIPAWITVAALLIGVVILRR